MSLTPEIYAESLSDIRRAIAVDYLNAIDSEQLQRTDLARMDDFIERTAREIFLAGLDAPGTLH